MWSSCNVRVSMMVVAAISLAVLLAANDAKAAPVMVDFSSQANFQWAPYLTGAPTGLVTLGGIPFDIKSNLQGNQAWAAGNGGVTGQQSLTIPLSVFGATTVYTLINTGAGQPGPNSYAWITFTGSAGASYTKYLVGNIDIRNYADWGWTGTINGTTTVNVFQSTTPAPEVHPARLDMQMITLPSEFAGQTLTGITVVDNGGPNFQRIVLDGVTVVPEPATVSLLALGGLAVLRRKRK